MNFPKDLKYSEEHEWVRMEGKKAYIGITDYAQDSLGDVVYIELPKVGSEIKKGEEVTNIESVKAASAIYTPVSGTIVEVNSELDSAPELINQKPYDAYIFCVEVKDPKELDSLLDAQGYQDLLKEKH